MGRAGRRRAGDGRARARRHPRRRRWPAARRSRHSQAGAPRGHQPGDRHPGGARRPGRRPAGDPGLRPGLPPARRCRGSPRARPTRRSASAWLTGPVGRELVELAGPMDVPAASRPREPGSERGRAAARPRRDRAPPAPAPDRGPDERRDRRRARPRRGRRGPGAWRACSPGSARRAAPRRPRSRSAGSRRSGPTDGHPGARRPPQVHRRRQLHHARPDGLRLARGRLRQEPTSSGPTASTRSSCARPRSRARPRPSSSRTSPSSCPGSCAARPVPPAGS